MDAFRHLKLILLNLPCGSKDVDTIKSLGPIHLGQHLIDYSISHSSAVVTAAEMSTYDEAQRLVAYRRGAIESNSSKKSTQGLAALALSNNSRT